MVVMAVLEKLVPIFPYRRGLPASLHHRNYPTIAAFSGAWIVFRVGPYEQKPTSRTLSASARTCSSALVRCKVPPLQYIAVSPTWSRQLTESFAVTVMPEPTA